MSLLPLTLTPPEGSAAVVVGGGPVAERKIRALLAGGLQVWVVAPEITPGLQDLAAAGRVRWLARSYTRGDLAQAWLACAATDARAVNRAVAAEARERGIWVNVADCPGEGTVRFPAVHREGDVVVAVSTLEGRPRRAQAVRDRIAAILPLVVGEI